MYNKAAAKPGYAKPAPVVNAAVAGSRPGASLSIGVKNGDGLDFHDLTGLFDAVDKKGADYYRVSVKEDLYIPKGAGIYLHTNKVNNNPLASLSYGVSNAAGKMDFTDVIDLHESADKSGKNYFKGQAYADIVIPAGSLFFARPKLPRKGR